MNKHIKFIQIIIILILFSLTAQAQRKRNKGTSKREIRKRQEKANANSNYNKFNELIPMGSSASVARNDFIWSYETANTVSPKGADLSIVEPIRYSFKKGREIGTSLASLPFAPMLFYKHVWYDDKVVFSTRHQFYSYTPSLNYLRKQKNYNIIPENSVVPEVITMKNELIVSKAFLKTLKCGGVKQPYLIITGAIAYDYAYAITETDVEQLENKFLQSRSGVILGNGSFATARIQGDAYISKGMYLTAAVRGLFASNNNGNSIEHNASVKMMLSPKFSTTLGYWMNFGKGKGTFILPVVNLTLHLGQKQSREKGLFGKGRY